MYLQTPNTDTRSAQSIYAEALAARNAALKNLLARAFSSLAKARERNVKTEISSGLMSPDFFAGQPEDRAQMAK